MKTRTAVRILGDLNLLHVADLAALAPDGNDVDMSQTQAALIAEVLRRCGFDDQGIFRFTVSS